MISLSDALAKYKSEDSGKGSVNLKRYGSQRAEILAELYEFYREDWKKSTWKNYIQWLKKHRTKHSEMARVTFKSSSNYFAEMNVKYFAVRLAHIPTEDLYYLISIAKDKQKRNEDFNRWLFGSLKVKE